MSKDDVLLSSFRDDISYNVRNVLLDKGLTQSDLAYYESKYHVLFPWNPKYDSYRYGCNRRVVVYPVMIVLGQKKKDILFALKMARDYSFPLSIRSGAHHFEGLSGCDGIILDMSFQDSIEIIFNHRNYSSSSQSSHKNRNVEGNGRLDNEGTLVKIGGGTVQGALVKELGRYNLAFVSGSCPGVGVIGYALGGGVSFLNRKRGLGCDSLVEVKLLLADGQLIKVSHKDYPDLFWALRGGGGGNFGIVISATFQVYPVPKVSYVELTFPFEAFRPVIKLYDQMVYHADRNLNLEFSTHGQKSNIVIAGLYDGPLKNLRDIMTEFLELKGVDYEKVEVVFEEVSYLESARHFAGKGHWLPCFKIKNGMFGDLRNHDLIPDALIDIMIEYMSGIHGDLATDILELSPLGGRVADISNQMTAYPHRYCTHWILVNAHWSTQSQQESQIKWVTEFYEKMRPFFNGIYVNGQDLEEPEFLERAYLGNYQRLKEIKKKYDPDNLFKFPLGIPIDQ